MFDFLRPVQDSSLRIMIPEKHHIASGQEESPCDEPYDDEERDPILPGTSSTSMGRYLNGSLARNVSPLSYASALPTHPAALLYQQQQQLLQQQQQPRRHYKAYTVMQRSGFQHTEYVQIITHLCKAEILISFLFLIHGFTCPGFPDESSYQGTCHINVLAALVGIFTGGMGLGAVHKFRWKTMLVMWLIMCIISSVANLLAVITTGVWLDHLSKLKARTGMANGLSGMMLLGSVLVGVCFILTSVLICHYWASNSTKYQTVGKIAKRTRSLRRRASRANSGDSPNGGSGRYGYHSGYGSGGGGPIGGVGAISGGRHSNGYRNNSRHNSSQSSIGGNGGGTTQQRFYDNMDGGYAADNGRGAQTCAERLYEVV